MSENKHTPGPWKIEPPENNNLYWRIRGSQLGTRFKIANVLYAAETPHERNQSEANARLIASVPDMLEALEEAETDLACYDGDSQWPAKNATLKRIRAAIAKATGKEAL
jgi:hypothetical protein